MAAFLIDISSKDRGQLFSKRRKVDAYEDWGICGNPDFGFRVIDVDPWKDAKWSGKTLEKWHQNLKKQFEAVSEKLITEVLRKTHTAKFESWMDSLLDLERSNSEEFNVLQELLEMVETFQENNGTIIFIGD